MTICGSTTSAIWGCNRTAVKLLNPVSSRSSSGRGSFSKQFSGNVAALHYFAPVRKPLSNLVSFSCRAISTTQARPPHIRATFDQLNAEQLAAVQTEEDCVRVVAGPGSGKTLVLTHRIAHLIENRRVDPSKILCITFTNKAKNELQERLRKLLGERSSKLTIGTYHSVCVRMLRESMSKEDLGVDKDFVIYDAQDSIKVIIRALVETLQDWKKTSRVNCEEIHEKSTDKKQKKPDSRAIQDSAKSIAGIKEYELRSFLEKQKQSRKLPAMPLSLQSALPLFKRYQHAERQFLSFVDELELRKEVAVICDIHWLFNNQSILRSYNAVDFDDLIYLTVRMLHRRSDLCQKYQNRWRYVLADEFQDTDWAQYVLVRLLCATHQRLFVVGDVDQAIYGWRGADYRNMDDLKLHFESVSTFELRKNYRSSRNILKLASEVINMSSRADRTLRPLKLQPVKSSGPPVTVVCCFNADQEAIYVLDKICTSVARGQASYGSFGILYRTRAQGELLEKWCLAKHIPYKISGSLALLSFKEVKDLRAYLQLIWNPEDRVALDRIINTPPRGLGPKTLTSVEQWASDLNISFSQALQKISKEEISHKDLGITLRARNSIVDFCKLQEDLVRLSANDKVSTLIQQVIDRTQIVEYYKRSDGNDGKCASHLKLFQELALSMDSEHGSGRSGLCSFLEAVALSASLDQEDEKKLDVVKLSTLHAAKGLEFDYVFITGADDGTLPLINTNVEEERRLFYVGVTRARKELVITSRNQKMVPGVGFIEGTPSRFLEELNPGLYKEETCRGSPFETETYMNGYAMI